jgi:DNA mismatch endonuclease (patch repair protein)
MEGRQDDLTPEQRTRAMRAVRGRDTGPELILRRSLWAAGIRGWRCHRSDLPGRPDLAFGIAKIAVFVDGAFWHGRPDKYWPGRSGPYWDAKIARNARRDLRVDAELRRMGWRVVRLWDSEVLSNSFAAASRIAEALGRQRGSGLR